MAAKCGLTSPDGAKCIMTIPGHVDCMDGKGGSWPNTANIARATASLSNPLDRRTAHQKKQDIKARIRKMKPEERAGDIRIPKTALRRNTDPSNSHEAIERYEPGRDTAKGRVLAHLRAHLGQWIDAVDFTDPAIGGFAGTRRLRELRDAGWPIETRPRPGTTNVWQHRLVAE